MLRETNFHSALIHIRRSSLVLTPETDLLDFVPPTLTVSKTSVYLTMNFHITNNI